MADRITGKTERAKIGKSSFYLFRHFQSISLVSIIVIVTISVIGLRSILSNFVLYEAENDALRFSVAMSELEMKHFFGLHHDNEDRWVFSPEGLSTLDQGLRLFLAPFDVYKIKIYDSETRIIYSTDSTIIGRLDPNNEELLMALSGSPISKYESKDVVWDLEDEQRTDVKIVETYVPLRGKDGKIIGSFEVYKDITTDMKKANRTLISAGFVLIITVLIVFGVLMFVIRRVTNVIDTRNADLMAINELLTQEVEERKRLQKEILSVIEKEQRRIGRELHDSIGQELTGISFMSKALSRKLNSNSLTESADAEQIVTLINRTIERMRGLTYGLHPVDIENLSLESNLRELVTSTRALFGIRCTLEYDKTLAINDNGIMVQLYRIVQETISNAIKHGKAKNVRIKLASNQEYSTLTVENDGLDFPGKKIEGKGLGIYIMAYRAEMIGGTFHIERGIEGGTIATCVFPNK